MDFRDKKPASCTQPRTRPRRRPSKRAPELLRTVATTHKGKRLRVVFEDETRIGQKGRVCHRWYPKGERPPGLADNRFTFAYLFAACEAGTDNAFALVLPEVSTRAMQLFLDAYAQTIKPDEHVIMFMDQAGWHVAKALAVPENITIATLPAYSPELNPVERVWLYLKERFLSHRLLDDYDAIVEAACAAWNRLLASPGRLASLTCYGWPDRLAEMVAN